jgi:hypothetical protein
MTYTEHDDGGGNRAATNGLSFSYRARACASSYTLTDSMNEPVCGNIENLHDKVDVLPGKLCRTARRIAQPPKAALSRGFGPASRPAEPPSATGLIDNCPGGTSLRWQNAPSGRT